MVPDPTAYIKNRLGELFVDGAGSDVPLSRFVSELGMLCPVSQDGLFHDRIVKWLPNPNTDSICTAISLALLRLVDRQVIEFKALSDAPVKVVMDGSEPLRYSHIRLKREPQELLNAV